MRVMEENAPTFRDSYGMTMFQHSLYVFCGSFLKQQFNDMTQYDILKSCWKSVEITSGSPPPPRDIPIFTSISDQFIFLYGGISL